jgi:hypothetical protein
MAILVLCKPRGKPRQKLHRKVRKSSAQLVENDWVAGFSLRNQLVANNPAVDFQDRLFNR